MKQIKLFRSSTFTTVEKEVNTWLSKNDGKVESISFSSAPKETYLVHSVMIVYNESEDAPVFDPNSISAG